MKGKKKMPFDSEGNFTRIHSWEDDRVNDIEIVTDHHDAEDDNFASGLSQALLKDGRAPMKGDLNLGNFKIKNLEKGVSDFDAVNKKQLGEGLDLKENISNKVKEVDDKSTDDQYPTAKLFYTKTKELTDNSADIKFSNLSDEAKSCIFDMIAPDNTKKQSVGSYPFTATKAGWFYGGWQSMANSSVSLDGVQIAAISRNPDGTNSCAFQVYMNKDSIITVSGENPFFATFVPCKGNKNDQ